MTTLIELVSAVTGIKNDIAVCHTKLKDTLIKKNVTVSQKDKMGTLIDKVVEIKQAPEGWDTIKNGEVVGGAIKQNDAVVWKKYGNWDTNLDQVKDFAISTYVYETAISEDGKYLAIGTDGSYLHLYKNENDVFTKMPNPDVKPSQAVTDSLLFSNDGSLLFACCGGKIYCYSNNNGILTSIVAPKVENTTDKPAFRKVSINKDATILVAYAGISGDSNYSYALYIFSRNKTTNEWTQLRRFPYSSWNYRPVCNPSGDIITILGESYLPYIYLKTNGEYQFGTDMSGGGLHNITWVDDHRFIAELSDSIAMYSFNPNSQLTNIKKLSSINIPRGFERSTVYGTISPDESYYTIPYTRTLNKSIYLYLYKINSDNTFSKANELYIDWSLKELVSSQNYLALSSSSKTLLYRTTTKDIVMPLDQIYKDTLMTKEIGVAMDTGVVGQNIRVNTFPKLKL